MNRIGLSRLVLASALLVLVIVACSAYLRLAQSGLGCSEWPDCYAGIAVQQPGTAPATDATAPAGSAVVRGLHRISASIVSILLMVILLMGWEGLGSFRSRLMAILAVVLAGFLAWLGRFTPSTLPAVLLGNLLGGMVMAALLFALWRRLEAPAGVPGGAQTKTGAPAGGEMLPGWLAGVLLLMQIALGGLIGARHAALACRGLTGCGDASGADWSLFNPFAEVALAADNPALQALAVAHRVGAVLVAVVVAAWAMRLIRAGEPWRRSGTLLLVLLIVQVILGATATLMPSPLWAVLLHNLVAALLLSVLAGLLVGSEQGR